MPTKILTEEELEQALKELTEWHIITSPRPDNPSQQRVELVKLFTFADYTAAIEFLASTVPHINALDHHPRWENEFKRLTAHHHA